MDFSEKAKKNVILKVRVGSHLFGTDTEESDLDMYGIFMPFDEIVYGSYKCENVNLDTVAKDGTGRNTKDAVDYSLTEYRKFVRLAMENNPNVLHLLFADEKNILKIDDYGRRLLAKADIFPHKGLHKKFMGYAKSQMHKMTLKPENHAKLELGLEVLSIVDNDRVLADVMMKHKMDNPDRKVSKDFPFQDLGKGKHIQCGDLHLERGLSVSRARKMIQTRLDNASHRAENYKKFGFDAKYASNLIHLLMEGREFLETGQVQFPLSYRQEILDIKQGKYSLAEINEWAEDLIMLSESAYERTKLPSKPRTEEIESFMMFEVKKYLKEL